VVYSKYRRRFIKITTINLNILSIYYVQIYFIKIGYLKILISDNVMRTLTKCNMLVLSSMPSPQKSAMNGINKYYLYTYSQKFRNIL